MTRLLLLTALALALAACAAQRTPSYVVRLDLDRIEAQTAARDPGFATLGPSASQVSPS